MWKKSLWLLLITFGFSLSAQDLPELKIQKAETEFQLRFLASDEMKGRRTGSEENNLAARFIANHLESYGYQPAPGLDDYFQRIPFAASTPPKTGKLVIGKTEYTYKEDFIIMTGDAASLKTTGVFAGHGWVDKDAGHDDYKDLDVKGKVVFVLPGPPEGGGPQAIFEAMKKKREIAMEKGAAGLIELFRIKFPWQFFQSYFGNESLGISKDSDSDGKADQIIYGWLKEKGKEDIAGVQKGKKNKIELASSGFSKRSVASNNVIGVLEGSDPDLKDEYILITAHFDHVGTGKNGGAAFTEQDSIFNGARDNAMGTVALLAAAKSLALAPPKRSVIVLAVTGEELGLLGSGYYASNPLIPLNKTVANLNTDGAGYSDTDVLSVFGAKRTGNQELVESGAGQFGLEVVHNPAPEQGLYDRSDNVSFARKGIPAISISPGFRELNQEIMQHYHQVSDEPGSMDFDYLLKYCKAFAHIARLLADNPERAAWTEGDKYEKAGQELYKE